jgi:Uma2 family endonuclease
MPTIDSLSQLDLDGRYTYTDYLSWKFEEAVEIIKGKIMPMASPSVRHQKISWRLTLSLGVYLRNQKCQAFAAPFDVRLYDKKKSAKANMEIFTVVQPDICIVCDETKLDDKGCKGAPDLVVEILSPGNSAKEMRLKKDLYEESGVKEYWIFDPEHETVHQFSLTKSGKYGAANIYINTDSMDCVIFPEMKVDLTEIF